MKITSLLIVLLLSCLTAFAATLSGDVKTTGQSAVVLETVPAKAFPAPKQSAAMDQRGMQFTPALLVIQQGTTVVFSNDDSVAHNVFWPNISGNKRLGHNLGTFNKGKTLSFKYDNAGNVPLLCNVYPEMAGTIVVGPSPYFAATDAAATIRSRTSRTARIRRPHGTMARQPPKTSRSRATPSWTSQLSKGMTTDYRIRWQ